MSSLQYVFIFFVFSSCFGQTKEKYRIPIPEASKDITADNFVDRVVSQIKHYDKEAMYFIRPLQNNCVYELLINDFPVYKDYGIEKLATPININRAILQSGPQTVTVRLYPLGDALKRAYGDGETITKLLPKSEMKVKVVKYEAFNISDELEDEIVVKEHTSPTKEGSEEFEGAGLPYYEYTFTFDAEVPYKNEGWLNGEDLTKFDKKELENQVLKYYNEYIQISENKLLDRVLSINFLSEVRRRKSQYHDKKYVEDILLEFKKETIEHKKSFQPLENYTLSFYGNNRIVCLKFPSKEPVKRQYRGKSAVWYKYKNEPNGPTRGRWLDLYLYLPTGQSLGSLQMIP
ncbi:hypothetical protein [Aquimarina algicola]|uniref:Uncharacterized protein n=1 Tax=Aquimarina algicola TaxID=2589995 RepID=A0A504J9S6_9FLAO|nr:hypothetical protein [Aquimarina algicola]TPN82961.1 hypothetical protein FHK87_21280 [Aquimarina algicola]